MFRGETTWSIALLLFSEILDLVMLLYVGIPSVGFIQELANLSECRSGEMLNKLATYFLKPDAAQLLIDGIENFTKLMDFGSTRSKREFNFDIPDISEKIKPELIYPVVLFAMMIVSVFIVFILTIHVFRIYIACCLISIELKTRNSILSSTNSSDIPIYFKPPMQASFERLQYNQNQQIIQNSNPSQISTNNINISQNSHLHNSYLTPKHQLLYTQTLSSSNFRPGIYSAFKNLWSAPKFGHFWPFSE